ncbi:uncharacterized protein PITG_14875 [Phytophthora infestans T30-4]|uniref:Uncharacterized protein n=1 Tax=Phytophthora infestans (strain T30-4) TaxID=403677 RepID=D0NP82_PHYIT|nr:uncharacterized protein PITG_14875 [Phytophthora infestans T30-4]EEY62424.1 hypothetical protein PITG_14875 [Phytophthora infestans T30-4]|eukprot:XP_002899060.1 hypothetical protein PITG_14875 [Phytophthora infestans T30-4]
MPSRIEELAVERHGRSEAMIATRCELEGANANPDSSLLSSGTVLMPSRIEELAVERHGRSEAMIATRCELEGANAIPD